MGLRLALGLSLSGAISAVGAPVTPISFSPTDHSEFLTISGSNLVATRSSIFGSGSVLARSNTSQNNGTRLITFSIIRVAGLVSCGIGNGAAALGSYAGDANSAGYRSGGNVFLNNGFAPVNGGPNVPSYMTGDSIRMQVDLDAQTLQFAKNAGAFCPTFDISSLGTNLFVMCSLSVSAGVFDSVGISG